MVGLHVMAEDCRRTLLAPPPPQTLTELRGERRALSALSFRLSFHLALLGPSGAHWLDDPPT
jgi:hypothetical protein